MSNFDKKAFYETIFNSNSPYDISHISQNIHLGLSKYTEEIHSSINETPENTAVKSWWQACSSLFINKQITISDINYDDNSSKGEEYIELLNTGPLIVDISGFSINAGDEGQDYTVPEKNLLFPNESIKIYTHREDVFSFNSEQPIWNNKGDTGYIFDKEGIVISSWAYGKDAHRYVAIKSIHYDGEEFRTEGDEFIEIENTSPHKIDVSAWKITSDKNQEFTFPHDSILQPQSIIRVYTNRIDHTTGGYSFASNQAIWNNKGDSGKLIDAKGKTVSEYSY